MISEQLSQKWLSATALRKCFYLCSIIFFVFWIGWCLFFLIKSPWVLPTELDLYKASLFKKGIVPYLDFEDLRWPGRYVLWLTEGFFSNYSIVLALNWVVLFFWLGYFYFQLKKQRYLFFWCSTFFLVVLLFQGAFSTQQFLLTPILALWFHNTRKGFCWWRVVLSAFAFLLMPTLIFLYFFIPHIKTKEKMVSFQAGLVLNVCVFLYGMSLKISWPQAIHDFLIYWTQDSELSQLSLKILVYDFFTQTLKMVFTPIFSLLLLLIFLPFLLAKSWRLIFFKKFYRKNLFFFAACVLYPCLTLKYLAADYLFLLMFLIIGSLYLLRKSSFFFSIKIFAPLVFVLLLGTGMRSFSWFYHDQEYLRPPYYEVREYLKNNLKAGDKFLVYAGGENRFFLLHRDLNSPPWLFMWDKFNLFIQLKDEYQIQRQMLYINQIQEVKPRFILVPPVSTINPNGPEVLNDFYALMDLRTQEYKIVQHFDSFFGPIVLYERN